MVVRKKTSRGSAEDRLIARHFRPLATHPGALGLADDAAVVKVPPGRDHTLLWEVAHAERLQIRHLRPRRASLEEVFLKAVGPR